MTMTIYFTATKDADVASALDGTPPGPEVLTSVVAPDGAAFEALVRLIAGTRSGESRGPDFVAYSDVVADATKSLVKLGSDLVAEIADRDAAEFVELAAPWERTRALDGSDGLDVTDFLTDLQHLCRNAVAVNHGVYAVESS